MARIRTIKPEFPQSESMGRVSRDARLLFIQLWTIADDAGRLRGNSRMLASLLFPYDDDARSLIDGWLAELERERCVRCYKVAGDSYVQVCNWLNHQKIDKPSKSKLPAFVEPSRELANPLDPSSGDQGPKDQRTEDQGGEPGEQPPADPVDPVDDPDEESKGKKQTFADWITALDGQDAIPADDTIFEWADKVGVPADFLELAWVAFQTKYSASRKKYIDWRAVFRNAVRDNWLKIWWIDADGQYRLTTVGEQVRRAA